MTSFCLEILHNQLDGWYRTEYNDHHYQHQHDFRTYICSVEIIKDKEFIEMIMEKYEYDSFGYFVITNELTKEISDFGVGLYHVVSIKLVKNLF